MNDAVSPLEPHRLRPRLLVVGNGPVGFAFCRRLAELGGTKRYNVTVIGEEPQPAYDRINLTSWFENTEESRLLLADRDWYARNHITLRTGERIARIDREGRRALTETGEVLPFDRLILATGSSAFMPPIPGNDLPNVFVYRTLADVAAIQNALAGKRSGIVIGGGLLGLEAAKVLHDAGLKTTIVEVAPALMSRQLDVDGAATLLRQVQRMGVDIKLQHRSTRITQSEQRLKIEIAGHPELTADMIVFSVGIRPRDELARGCQLAIGDRGGVVVDDELRTSDPGIHAIGECAEHRGHLYGLYAPGYLMADVLARRLMEENVTFAGADFSAKLKLMGVEVATVADFLQPDHETEVYAEGDVYRKLLFDDGKLVGAILVGDCPERHRLEEAIQSGRRIGGWARRRFRRRGRLWSNAGSVSVTEWPANAIVCTCRQVCRGELTDLCEAGRDSVAGLGEACGAGTVCGSCRPLLAQLVGETEPVAKPKGRTGLVVSSVAALLVMAGFLLFGPVNAPTSVRDSLHEWFTLWESDFWKQVTGFTLVGIMVLSLGLSLRKRIPWLRFGDYGLWRMLHSLLGAGTVAGVLVHTGGQFGNNLNFALLAVFLGLNAVGAITAVAVAGEVTTNPATGTIARRARPWLTRLHIWMFWPLPVLLAFHILTVYYY